MESMESMDALEMLEELDREENSLRAAFPDWTDDDIYEEMCYLEDLRIQRQCMERHFGRMGF